MSTKLTTHLKTDRAKSDPVLRRQDQDPRCEPAGAGEDCADQELSAEALRRRYVVPGKDWSTGIRPEST